VPVLAARKGRHLRVEVYPAAALGTAPLLQAARWSTFRGREDALFVLPRAWTPSAPLYLRVTADGALFAMALSALLIWFILPERLFVLYATLFALQGLYIAYLSGQGFDWMLLDWATPLNAHAWNVPAALSGAAATLFVREFADLQRFSPRVYTVFGWLALAFVGLAFANLAHVFGLGAGIASLGNLLFLATAVFTLVVALLAWLRGSRAAGWFLIAWGLPLSMVAAAVLVALGVADRLREQRQALTDPITGVLNRRSLLERLDAACLRARALGLPIPLLFIDLDHFKAINDSFGHPAGDACLLAAIRPIQAELRQSDVIGRYGGEEFVVILSSADAAAARAIAERILQRVADLRVEGFGPPMPRSTPRSIPAATRSRWRRWQPDLEQRAQAGATSSSAEIDSIGAGPDTAKPCTKSSPSERQWSRIASLSTDFATVKKPQTRAIWVQAATIACENTSVIAAPVSAGSSLTMRTPGRRSRSSWPSAIEKSSITRPQPMACRACATRVAELRRFTSASAWISNASVPGGRPARLSVLPTNFRNGSSWSAVADRFTENRLGPPCTRSGRFARDSTSWMMTRRSSTVPSPFSAARSSSATGADWESPRSSCERSRTSKRRTRAVGRKATIGCTCNATLRSRSIA